MNLLLKLISSPWFWLDVFLSISGGIIVWRGLLIEKRAEQMLPPQSFKPDIFADIIEKYKSEMERGWRILMGGIIIEVIAALGISIISGLEIATLNDKAELAEKEAGQANERAANTESNNLVLRSNVVSLEFKIKPRIVTNKQLNDFIFLTEKIGKKFPVSVGIGNYSDEACNYAHEIRYMLNRAGFNTPDSDTNNFAQISYHPEAGMIHSKTGNTNEFSSVDIFSTDTNNLTVYPMSYEFTNGFNRPYSVAGPENETNRVLAELVFVFNQIGIPAGNFPHSQLPRTEDGLIFICQKP